MLLIYLLFFGVLNLLIFDFLTKKIKISLKTKIGLFLFIFLVLILHFLILSKTVISNNHFFHLLISSVVLVVFHFGSMVPILIMQRINKNFENHIALVGFNVIRFYIMYLLVYLYQCISLLSSNAREHFNSIDFLI